MGVGVLAVAVAVCWDTRHDSHEITGGSLFSKLYSKVMGTGTNKTDYLKKKVIVNKCPLCHKCTGRFKDFL